MKIDFITMHAVFNYGSALQTYATQKLFENKGYNVEIINYYPNRMNNYGSLRQIYTEITPFYRNKWKAVVVSLLKYPAMKQQKKSFKSFSDKYFHLTRMYNSNQELITDPPKADIYCTGSDQVWNDFFENNQYDKSYFLNFGSENVRRIAYSASFGRNDILEYEIEGVRDLLERYNAISVREMSGLDIIRHINVPLKECVLDPTLMLSRAEWKKIAYSSKEKNYILVYQLHEDTITSQIAREIGKRTGKKVIRVSCEYFKRIKKGKTIVAPQIEEFLGYIMNADLVITDSFHGTAFSVNLNVPFISVRWKMFNDRIETLLNSTGIGNRCVDSMEDALEIYEKPIDFSSVNEKLYKLREKSEKFLASALKNDAGNENDRN